MHRSEPLTIRPAAEGQEEQIADLLALAYGWSPEKRAAAVDHLRWKMSSHPLAAGGQLIAIAGGKIVGTYLRIVRPVFLRTGDLLARDAVDLAVHPDFRQRGIYRALSEYSRRHLDGEFDLAMSFSLHPAVDHRRMQLDSRPLANRIQVLVRVDGIGRFTAGRKSRLPRPVEALGIGGLALLGRVSHRPYRRPQRRDGWSIETVERFDERVDGFFREAARPFDFIIAKSRDYVNWRYCDPRAGAFTVRVAQEAGALLGYVVYGIAGDRAVIPDLLALPRRADVVRSLIEDALDALRSAGVASITCWMATHHPYNGILRRYGFLDLRGKTGLMCAPLRLPGAELDFLGDPRARVHVVMGDSDWSA